MAERPSRSPAHTDDPPSASGGGVAGRASVEPGPGPVQGLHGAPVDGRVVVVGMGNVLTGDDALGPTAVRHFQAIYEDHARVEVVDAGTPGMDLAGLIADATAVIVVDTVLADDPVGTVKVYDRDRLLSRPLQPRTNPHAPGLSETILSLQILGLGPSDVLLVGVVPGEVEVGRALSAELEAAIPEVLAVVVGELERLGTAVVPREDPEPPDLWWKRSPVLSGRS